MNKEQDSISDELLNAYLDGQLDAAERGRVLAALRDEQGLADRACALRQVKELTRHGYSDVQPPLRAAKGEGARAPLVWSVAAALCLMVVSALFGWLAHEHWRGDHHSSRILSLEEAQPQRLLARTGAAPARVIVHVSSGQPQRLGEALDRVEQLMRMSDRKRLDLQLEIIANADGLDLLRLDTSPYAQRISTLVERYHNLSFLACNRAVERLQQQGVEVTLLPEARLADSALQLILYRLREGWTYVKA